MIKNVHRLTIKWKWSSFEELSISELHAILKLRQEIFIVEQKCIYLDCDGLDRRAWHFTGMLVNETEAELIAYLRVVFPGRKTDFPVIGRLLTHKKIRRKGIGKQLLRQGIIHTNTTYPDSPISISAQLYLEPFYNSFGFTSKLHMQGA